MTSEIKVDTISEQTSANGVTIDGLTIKDGNIQGSPALVGTTPSFTIGDGGAEDTKIVFDGNALDYYIGLDDSADNLIIGSGSTVGSNSLITIDSDGDFTLDSAGDIILDVGGGDISLKGTGAEYGKFNLSGNSLNIHSSISDGDIVFKGSDGGSAITALTLDMSDAGTASFNHDIKLVDGAVIDCAGDVIFDIDGGDLSFKDGGTSVVNFGLESGNFIMNAVTSDTDMIFKGNDGGSAITALTLDMSAAGNATFNGAIIANAGVSVDNITIDGTEIDLSSGDLTLDVAGDIILDADGADVSFRDDGTGHLSISNSSNDAVITSLQSDKDVIFKGVDGGSLITALTLDMSTGGQLLANPLGVSVPSYSFAGDSNTGMTRPTGDTIQFVTAGAEVFRITSAGIHIGGTGSANALDDYEEGTWTPQLVSTGSYSGQAYTTQQGFYTKVGRAVTVTCLVTYSNKGTLGGDFMKIIGLPFTPTASITYQVAATQAISHTISPSGASPSAAVYANNAFAYLFNQSDDALSQYETGQPDNSTQWRFCVTYQV